MDYKEKKLKGRAFKNKSNKLRNKHINGFCKNKRF